MTDSSPAGRRRGTRVRALSALVRPRAESDRGGRGGDELREDLREVFLANATWTTCSPQDPDWYIRARELELDYDREVGTARGSSIVFMLAERAPAIGAPAGEH